MGRLLILKRMPDAPCIRVMNIYDAHKVANVEKKEGGSEAKHYVFIGWDLL